MRTQTSKVKKTNQVLIDDISHMTKTLAVKNHKIKRLERMLNIKEKKSALKKNFTILKNKEDKLSVKSDLFPINLSEEKFYQKT